MRRQHGGAVDAGVRAVRAPVPVPHVCDDGLGVPSVQSKGDVICGNLSVGRSFSCCTMRVETSTGRNRSAAPGKLPQAVEDGHGTTMIVSVVMPHVQRCRTVRGQAQHRGQGWTCLFQLFTDLHTHRLTAGRAEQKHDGNAGVLGHPRAGASIYFRSAKCGNRELVGSATQISTYATQ